MYMYTYIHTLHVCMCIHYYYHYLSNARFLQTLRIMLSCSKLIGRTKKTTAETAVASLARGPCTGERLDK